jgi:hypothetical protein
MRLKKRGIFIGVLSLLVFLLAMAFPFGPLLPFNEAFQISFADAIKQFSQAIKTGQWPYAAKQS